MGKLGTRKGEKMFKKMTLMALVAASCAGFAQRGWTPGDDPSNMDFNQRKDAVMDQAYYGMHPADAFDLNTLLTRGPSNLSMALAMTLSKNTYEARIVGHEIALSRIPAEYVTSSYTNYDGTVTTTTTTTYAMVEPGRPMRLYMMNPAPRDIDYDQALYLLTDHLDASEATNMRDWWWNKSTEREKDVIVRFLEANGRFADVIIYPSTLR
jgi:hypothetical protein